MKDKGSVTGMTSKNYDFIEGGFKFRVIDEDYGYCKAKTKRYKYCKETWNMALRYKETNEHGFSCNEHDCCGGTEIRIKLVRKGKYMYVYRTWCKDI